MSDFQYLQHILDGLVISEEANLQDGHTLGPAEIHEYLSQVMYQRRTKMDPLWNSLLVGGVKDGKRWELLLPHCLRPGLTVSVESKTGS
jgi:20S proteasome subunit beta 7